MSRGLLLLMMLVGLRAVADDAETEAQQQRQLDVLRGEVANQFQLQAAELIDELVYGWTQQAPFDVDAAVVLAGVSVPVSLGTGLEAYLENHLAGLVVKNPRGHVTLVHCPACSAWVFHSGAAGTVVSRGYDAPEALQQAGLTSGARYALFLDLEAEGSSLVLRARITTLDATRRIVFARTLSTATAVPAMLRAGERLTSVSEARKEYLDALAGRLFLVPVRFGVRTYAPGTNGSVGSAPFLWLTAGLEASFSQARAWTGTVSAGVSWLPQSHVAVMGQVKISRLLTGSTTSLTSPDLYIFAGAGVMFGVGNGMLIFRNSIPTIDQIINFNQRLEPRETLGITTVGLELRVKNRIGLIVSLEGLPGITGTDTIGEYINIFNLGILRFQSFNLEVSFCF